MDWNLWQDWFRQGYMDSMNKSNPVSHLEAFYQKAYEDGWKCANGVREAMK